MISLEDRVKGIDPHKKIEFDEINDQRFLVSPNEKAIPKILNLKNSLFELESKLMKNERIPFESYIENLDLTNKAVIQLFQSEYVSDNYLNFGAKLNWVEKEFDRRIVNYLLELDKRFNEEYSSLLKKDNLDSAKTSRQRLNDLSKNVSTNLEAYHLRELRSIQIENIERKNNDYNLKLENIEKIHRDINDFQKEFIEIFDKTKLDEFSKRFYDMNKNSFMIKGELVSKIEKNDYIEGKLYVETIKDSLNKTNSSTIESKKNIADEINKMNPLIEDFDNLSLNEVLDINYDPNKFDKFSDSLFFGKLVEEYRSRSSELINYINAFKKQTRKDIDSFFDSSNNTLSNKPENFSEVKSYVDNLDSLSLKVSKLNLEYSKLNYRKEGFISLDTRIGRDKDSYSSDLKTFNELNSALNRLQQVDETNYYGNEDSIDSLLGKEFKFDNAELGLEADTALSSYTDQRMRIKGFIYNNKKEEEDNDSQYFAKINDISKKREYFDIVEPLYALDPGVEFQSTKIKDILTGKERDVFWNEKFDASNNYFKYAKEPKYKDTQYFFMHIGDMINKSKERGYIGALIEQGQLDSSKVDLFLRNVSKMIGSERLLF
ncbi:hypothetical protein C0585_04075 [Candidatus Woesearchaeota archaeon]|nr:MAG: hypothetical protein C0585_04075 [Candidatus Woesearchaeota archaeon]